MRRRHLLGILAFVTATLALGAVAVGGTPDKANLANPPGGAKFASPGPPDDAQKAAEKAYFDRYFTWLDSPEAQALDVRSLPRALLTAEFKPSEPTLEVAIARSDVIVHGEAIQYSFGSWGSSMTLKVEAVLKGKAGSAITVSLPGGPQPKNLEFTDVLLAEGEASPILLPGDRAMLLLQRSADGADFSVQAYSGQYRIDSSDKVSALPGNTFGRTVAGMNITDFVGTIRQHVG